MSVVGGGHWRRLRCRRHHAAPGRDVRAKRGGGFTPPGRAARLR